MTIAPVQTQLATRVTSGRTITATFGAAVTGSMLVAIIQREGATGIPTIGQVTDGINKWRAVNEVSNTTTRGLDIWVCENPQVGSTPTVTAQLNLFPTGALSGMQMYLMELSGTTGFEICDAYGVATTTTTTVTVSTNRATTQAHDYVLSAVNTNAIAATIPSGWTLVLNDNAERLWIASNDSGASTGVQSAAWTGLVGSTSGCALIVAFRQTGVSANQPHLLQGSYYEPALGNTYSKTWSSQQYPINPSPASILVAAFTGAVYEPPPGGAAVRGSIYAGSVQAVTDSVSGYWRKMAEIGNDNVGGGNWSYWYCAHPPGGATTLTGHWDVPIQTPAALLLELAGCSTTLVTDSYGAIISQTSAGVSTAKPIASGDLALSTFGAIFARPWNPGAGWTVAMSDTNGVGIHMINLNTPAGVLTASIGASSPGADGLVCAFRPSRLVGVR